MSGMNRIGLNRLKPIIHDEEQVRYLTIRKKVAEVARTGTKISSEPG